MTHEPLAAASPHRAVFLDVAVFGTRTPEGAASASARPGECRCPFGSGEGRTSPFTTPPRYVAPIRGTFLPRPPRDGEGRAGLPPSGGPGAGNPLAQRAPARSRGPGKAKRLARRRDAGAQVAAHTRSAARPTGRRIAASETLPPGEGEFYNPGRIPARDKREA